MYNGLIHAHSGLRWICIVLILLAIAKAFGGIFGRRSFTSADKKIALFAMISLHMQLVIGLILYFISPVVELATADMGASMKDSALRFWAVEHILTMMIGIIIITIGYSKHKKATNDRMKFKRLAWSYTIGFIIILISIPWPFRAEGIARAWF